MLSPLGQFLKDRSYTQGKLATVAGVSQGRVGAIVRGDAALTGRVRDALASIAPDIIERQEAFYAMRREELKRDLEAA